MRLIDVDEFLEKINLAIIMMETVMENYELVDDPELKMELKAYKDIRNGIKEEPSITVNSEWEWVPCDERLPEKYGWYICTIKDGNVSSKYWTGKKWIDNVRKHMFELYNIFSKLTGEKITPNEEDIDWDEYVIAWMPLPRPYTPKGEADGKDQ